MDPLNATPDDPKPANHPGWDESVYGRLAGDDDGRVCKAVSEAACRHTPGSFIRMLVANALGTVGDRIASAKTTLPWLLIDIGAPRWIGALLVPIRESGSMLPQLLLGHWVRRQPVRRGWCRAESPRRGSAAHRRQAGRVPRYCGVPTARP